MTVIPYVRTPPRSLGHWLAAKWVGCISKYAWLTTDDENHIEEDQMKDLFELQRVDARHLRFFFTPP